MKYVKSLECRTYIAVTES